MVIALALNSVLSISGSAGSNAFPSPFLSHFFPTPHTQFLIFLLTDYADLFLPFHSLFHSCRAPFGDPRIE